jgi:hypothetical protein
MVVPVSELGEAKKVSMVSFAAGLCIMPQFLWIFLPNLGQATEKSCF